jgi:hypothetical protein
VLGQLLPKNQPTALWRRGLTTLNLALLEPLLARQGQRIRTEAGPPRSSLAVAVTFQDGQVRPCSLFVRESVHAEATPLAEDEDGDEAAGPQA